MKLLNRTLALILSLSLFFATMGQAQAAIIGNSQLLNQAGQEHAKNALLQTLARSEIQEQLLDMGVSTADIASRIEQMTQQEIAQLNQQIAQLPAGGDGLGLVVLVFLVFVITDVLGATDIFPFIRPIR